MDLELVLKLVRIIEARHKAQPLGHPVLEGIRII